MSKRLDSIDQTEWNAVCALLQLLLYLRVIKLETVDYVCDEMRER